MNTNANYLAFTKDLFHLPRQPVVQMGKQKVGGNYPVFITAECGINNDGTLEQGIELIDIAAKAECSAAKFQLFTAELMYARDPGKYKTATGEMKPIWELIKQNELRTEWLPKLKQHAESKGLEFFVTVCDELGGDVLDKLDVCAFKIASYEITHIPLIRYMAKKGRTIVFSSGGALMSEIDEAIRAMNEEGLTKIIHMHCMGQYPCAPEDAHVSIITTLRQAFPHVVVGYSDHTVDPIKAPKAAVALGAKMIEKHITPDKTLPGPDHSFAVNPSELALMVKTIRATEDKIENGDDVEIDINLLGDSQRQIYTGEQFVRKFCYRQIYATTPIRKGEKLTVSNIAVLRSGEKYDAAHIDPKFYPTLLSCHARREIPANQGVTWDDVLN